MFVTNYTKRFDYFAYPRVGSHFLYHIFSGLYELILFDSESFQTSEYLSRKTEINELSLYALSLKDSQKNFNQPIYINPLANGIHGFPIDCGFPVISLIRHPLPTVYSYFRVLRDRLNHQFEDRKIWVEDKLNEYLSFYSKVFDLKNKIGTNMIILKYENLISDYKYLFDIIKFINIDPKLDPKFVFKCLKFESFVNDKNRTFYRDADNNKWSEDNVFKGLINDLDLHKYCKYGYTYNP
jgi:hypothetical protein